MPSSPPNSLDLADGKGKVIERTQEMIGLALHGAETGHLKEELRKLAVKRAIEMSLCDR